jgi:hypothetical protein
MIQQSFHFHSLHSYTKEQCGDQQHKKHDKNLIHNLKEDRHYKVVLKICSIPSTHKKSI